MKSSIFFVPRASVELSPEEVEILLECSNQHYDGLCRSVGQPGLGSFVWGMKISGGIANLWDREIDLTLKILEQAVIMYRKIPAFDQSVEVENKAILAGKLTQYFRNLFFSMRGEFKHERIGEGPGDPIPLGSSPQ